MSTILQLKKKLPTHPPPIFLMPDFLETLGHLPTGCSLFWIFRDFIRYKVQYFRQEFLMGGAMSFLLHIKLCCLGIPQLVTLRLITGPA